MHVQLEPTVLALVLLDWVTARGGTFQSTGSTTRPRRWKTQITLTCDERTTLDMIHQPTPRDLPDDARIILQIFSCGLPAVSYLKSLPWLSILNNNLLKLQLENTPELNEKHIAGLSMAELEIKMPGVSYTFRGTRNVGPIEIVNVSEGIEVVMKCDDHTYVYSNRSALSLSNRVKNLHLIACPLPNESYAAALRQLNFQAETLSKFTLDLHNDNSDIRSAHFEGLTITSLKIINKMPTIFRIEYNLLEHLVVTLRELHVSRVKLPPLLWNMRVVNVTLEDGRSVGAWDRTWGGCLELQRLTVIRWEVHVSADNWLADCLRLRELELNNLQMGLVERLLIGAYALSSLTIIQCSLYRLPEFPTKAAALRKLMIVQSNFVTVNRHAYRNYTLLEELNLSSNQLDMWFAFHFMAKLPSLRSLTFNNNCCWKDMRDINYLYQIKFQSSPLLDRVSMYQSRLPEFIFGPWNTFSYLNLSGNQIQRIEFSKLPVPRSGHLEIDLRGNPIEEVNVTEEDYNSMRNIFGKENSSLTLLTDAMSLECDCASVWFARVLRAVPSVRAPGARCAGGGLLRHVPVGQLECDRDSCGNCTCRREWRDNATSASCAGDVYAVPRVPHLRALHANGSRIGTLQVADLPKTLELVDLRNNMISRLTAEVTTALFEVRERRVRLSGNPLVCDCDNRLLVEALQAHRTQVEDFNLLSCIYGLEQVALGDVQANTLCKTRRERVVLVVSVIVSLAAFAGVTALLCYRYRLIIKMFLYSRGCCLFCVREDEVDADRLYDAFVSFAHEDEEVVEEELLPGIEHEYKLCVHTRNWMPGLMINTQIVNSVDQSRRTIIVLSRNFVASIWGMLEFRTAYMSAMSEGRVRVIVVVLDDVLDDEDLDPELRSYVRTYTYLKFRDRWFWQKLRYALPHHRHRVDRSNDVTMKVQAIVNSPS